MIGWLNKKLGILNRWWNRTDEDWEWLSIYFDKMRSEIEESKRKVNDDMVKSDIFSEMIKDTCPDKGFCKCAGDCIISGRGN